MSALWGLAQWEWALRVHACAPGFPHGGPILTRKRARIFLLKGLVGLPPAPGVRRRRGCVSHSGRQCRPVRQVLFGEDGVAHLMKPGSAVMVSSTISSADAQEIAAALTALNLNMLDAPVSGGAVKAAQGEMTVMASGREAAFTRLKPVLDAVASNVYRISDTPGAGSTVKIIHQLLAGVHIAAAAEAMALAARAGIPLDVMYDVVTHAAGNSRMFENRMQHVVDGDYTPRSAVDIFVKDLGLVADTAKALRFPLPLASTALNMFTSASNAGYGKEDDSAVIKIFSGITLPGVTPEEPSC